MKTEKRDVSKFEDLADYEPGVIVCECASTDHSLIYQKWEEHFGDESVREVFLSFCLDPDRNFWKRLKNAYKYLFKKERMGTHGEIILTKRNISGFEDIIEFLKEE